MHENTVKQIIKSMREPNNKKRFKNEQRENDYRREDSIGSFVMVS